MRPQKCDTTKFRRINKFWNTRETRKGRNEGRKYSVESNIKYGTLIWSHTLKYWLWPIPMSD